MAAGLTPRTARCSPDGAARRLGSWTSRRAEFGRGDFLVRNVLGADRRRRRIAVGERSRSARRSSSMSATRTAADEDLRALLAGASGQARSSSPATAGARACSTSPTTTPGVINAELDRRLPTAGVFCAGEIGPIGGRNFVHGFTASVLLFDAD